MSLTDTKFELCRDVEHVLKIGREFQKQDNWRGAHHDTAKLLCDTIEHLRDQSNAQIGNAAAIREAAAEFVSVILDKKPGIHNLHRLAEKCRDALAKPPRNCDVGTAEEQIKRWEKFCQEHHEYWKPSKSLTAIQRCNCPCHEGNGCNYFVWAQMPYEAEEGGAQ